MNRSIDLRFSVRPAVVPQPAESDWLPPAQALTALWALAGALIWWLFDDPVSSAGSRAIALYGVLMPLLTGAALRWFRSATTWPASLAEAPRRRRPIALGRTMPLPRGGGPRRGRRAGVTGRSLSRRHAPG